MTRLNAMRALLAIATADDHQRVSRVIEGYETADAEKLAIKVKPKRKPRKTASSRVAFVRAVYLGKGA
jgi:hypothetical protein